MTKPTKGTFSSILRWCFTKVLDRLSIIDRLAIALLLVLMALAVTS